MTPTFIKGFRALTAVDGYLIVKAGVDGVTTAAANTDPLIGTADSMGAGRSFGVDRGGGSRFNLTTLAPLLQDVHERLVSVVIENLDWQTFLHRYDRPETLFYLDPPYWGTEDYYGKAMFERSQYEVMAGLLARLKGRFILSINDVPEVRSIFSGFQIDDVSLTYTAGGGKGKPVKEVIISNMASCHTYL